ncbi:DUF6477 family protein [Aliiruegeria sabulilitoris]|uniref:DUF6477 family protein n=1 Tax=Aliiruegeria sabulilitoris TaxID=1510458 RepID=UPI00082CBF13|nr:DUF6477 family protein [Aliiruegeria sabulilitoris]NDR58278.1 hypothetical protein [Pseudoruegeria sp. M32A2M]
MTDFTQALASLRRPGLLIRAARYGQQGYDRKRDLKRIAGGEEIPAPDRAVKRLMDLEAELEYSRRSRDAAYSASRHVETLIALMAEARALFNRGPVAV